MEVLVEAKVPLLRRLNLLKIELPELRVLVLLAPLRTLAAENLSRDLCSEFLGSSAESSGI